MHCNGRDERPRLLFAELVSLFSLARPQYPLEFRRQLAIHSMTTNSDDTPSHKSANGSFLHQHPHRQLYHGLSRRFGLSPTLQQRPHPIGWRGAQEMAIATVTVRATVVSGHVYKNAAKQWPRLPLRVCDTRAARLVTAAVEQQPKRPPPQLAHIARERIVRRRVPHQHR